jgi:ankyrin repeat protein
LEYGADPNSLGNEHFWLRGAAFEESVPPLIYAVSKDNSEIIQLLSKHGAAIDWINRNGLTLLNIAIANERFEAAKALVDAGADVTAPNANGETAFDIVSKKEEEVLEEKQKYIDQLERMEAFFLAHGAIEGQPNEATETETPSPPNDYPPNFREEPNPPSETPDFPNEATDQEQERQRAMFREAHLAVVCYDIEGLKGLIREGFDVNMRVDGQTILHEVAALFREEMVVLLLNNGAEIDITDKRNWTPLFCAVYGRQLGTLKLLLKRGATVNRVDSDGNTPLHIATIEELRYPERRGESIGVLLDAGADVNAAAKDGCTPLDRVHRLRAKALEIWQNAINELNQRTAFLREHKRKGKQSEESGTAEGRLESNES